LVSHHPAQLPATRICVPPTLPRKSTRSTQLIQPSRCLRTSIWRCIPPNPSWQTWPVHPLLMRGALPSRNGPGSPQLSDHSDATCAQHADTYLKRTTAKPFTSISVAFATYQCHVYVPAEVQPNPTVRSWLPYLAQSDCRSRLENVTTRNLPHMQQTHDVQQHCSP